MHHNTTFHKLHTLDVDVLSSVSLEFDVSSVVSAVDWNSFSAADCDSVSGADWNSEVSLLTPFDLCFPKWFWSSWLDTANSSCLQNQITTQVMVSMYALKSNFTIQCNRSFRLQQMTKTIEMDVGLRCMNGTKYIAEIRTNAHPTKTESYPRHY